MGSKVLYGKPATQCEGERNFSHRDTCFSKKSTSFPEYCRKKKIMLSKFIQFVGFVLYPDMDFTDYLQQIIQGRESGLPFAAFSEHMFKKWKTFKLSAGV